MDTHITGFDKVEGEGERENEKKKNCPKKCPKRNLYYFGVFDGDGNA